MMERGIAIEVVKRPADDLPAYSRIPIAFQVREVFDVVARAGGLGGLMIVKRTIKEPYLKDYDAIAGEGPLTWPRRFGLSNWQLFAARVAEQRVGGAAVILGAPECEMLEGRGDLAQIWDIRVAPEARGIGVGRALFRAAEEWSRARSARWLKVETQSTNVPACMFYARQGCELGAIHRFAYRDFPHEVQFLWYKDLVSTAD